MKKSMRLAQYLSSKMIRMPRMYVNASPQPATDRAFGFDPLARQALETYRSSYNPLPTASRNEFTAFFSTDNYRRLYNEVKRQCKGKLPDAATLYETMMWAFQTVAPRSDEMDERREMFDSQITASYVKELNKAVLERVTADVITANMQADTYYRYAFKGPIDYESDWKGYDEDTRTRWTGQRFDMNYMLP